MSRKSIIKKIFKSAQVINPSQLSVPNSDVNEFKTREHHIFERSNIQKDNKKLYGIFDEQPKTKEPQITEPYPYLSTRYVPGTSRQAIIPADGVRVDPYTGEAFDYNEGFKTSDGKTFPASHVSYQTKLNPK